MPRKAKISVAPQLTHEATVAEEATMTLERFITEVLQWKLDEGPGAALMESYGEEIQPFDAIVGTPTKALAKLLGVEAIVAGGVQHLARAYYTPKEEVQVAVEAAVEEEVAEVPASPFGPWDQYRAAGADIFGIASALAPRVDGTLVRRFGDAAMACVFDAAGVDTAVMNIAERRQTGVGPKIRDTEARTRLFHYRRERERGTRWLASEERQQAWTGVGNILDERFERVLAATAHFYNMRDEAGALGPQARITVGTGPMTLSHVAGLLPLVAERISEGMAAAEIPELSEVVIEEYQTEVLPILRHPAVQVASGVQPNPDDPNFSAIDVLGNEGFAEASNGLRLGLAYRNVMERLALCPETPDAQYVIFVGEAAAQVLTYATLFQVEGAPEVAPEAPFRPEPLPAPTGAPRPEAPSTKTRRWSINLALGISRS